MIELIKVKIAKQILLFAIPEYTIAFVMYFFLSLICVISFFHSLELDYYIYLLSIPISFFATLLIFNLFFIILEIFSILLSWARKYE